jgi:hypothetical protein
VSRDIEGGRRGGGGSDQRADVADSAYDGSTRGNDPLQTLRPDFCVIRRPCSTTLPSCPQHRQGICPDRDPHRVSLEIVVYEKRTTCWNTRTTSSAIRHSRPSSNQDVCHRLLPASSTYPPFEGTVTSSAHTGHLARTEARVGDYTGPEG